MKVIQLILGILAAVVFLIGILTGLGAIPQGAFILTLGGLQRLTDTLLFFSIAIGVWIIAKHK